MSSKYKEWIKTADYTAWNRNHADLEYECNVILSKNFAKKVITLAKKGNALKDGKGKRRRINSEDVQEGVQESSHPLPIWCFCSDALV